MADDLASLLAGNDPLSPQILQALQAQQARDMVSNPANWQNQGLAGGLARTLAGFLAPNPVSQVQGITAQRQAALPELAQIYAASDPLKEAASGNYSPIALARVLAGVNPLNAAQAREAAANAALGNLNVIGFQNAQGGAGGSPSSISAPASRGVGPPMGPMTLGPQVSGRPAQEPIQGAGDPLTAYGTPQAKAIITDPRQRAILLQRLRMMQAQHAQQAANPSVSTTPLP